MDWKDFLNKNKIDYAPFFITKDKEELYSLSKKLGYPVVLKANDLNHKSDKGGIIFVQNEQELPDAIKRIEKLSSSFLVQKKIKGVELIISCEFDSTFGSYIMLGVGGIYVEVLKDVSYGINPIDRDMAKDMINSLKLKDIIKGVRGGRDARKDVESLLVKLSKIAYEKNMRFEFNPVTITEDSLKVVDFR